MGQGIKLEQVIQAIEAADDVFTYFLTGRLERRYAFRTRLSQGWRMNPLRSFWKPALTGFSRSQPGMRSTITAS